MPKLDVVRPLTLASAAALALFGSGCAASLDDDVPELGDRPSHGEGGTVGAERSTGNLPGTIVDPPRDDQPVATIMASGQNAPGQTFVQGERLRWLDTTDEGTMLMGMSTDGGVPTLIAKLAESPFDGAIADIGLYLTAPHDRQILISKDASGEAQVVTVADDTPLAIAVAGERVFWSSAGGCIHSASLEGDEAVTLACGKGAPVSLAVAGKRIVWSTTEGALYSTSIEPTETAELLAVGEDFSASITADERRVYWASASERELRSVDIRGGAVETLARGELAVSDMTQGRFYVYFTTHSDGSVKRVAKNGGDVEVMVAGQNDPSYISQDDEFLFWANEGDGTIARISKW